MLYTLGYVTFDVLPINVNAASTDGSADYVAKDVLGSAKPQEFVGEGDTQMTLSGSLFPGRFGGELDGLFAMMKMGMPHILVRGDGTNLGWWIVTSVTKKENYLNHVGVGKKHDFDVSLTKDASIPSASSYLPVLLRLFG
jgi:phage protein U